MDLSLDRTTSHNHIANMSTHTSVDTPSNKINRGRPFKKGNNDNRNRQRFRTPTCFACGDPNHRIKDCTDQFKKEAYISKRKEKSKSQRPSPKTSENKHASGNQHACMAKISVAKKDVRSLTPQQIQELAYPQHIINDLL